MILSEKQYPVKLAKIFLDDIKTGFLDVRKKGDFLKIEGKEERGKRKKEKGKMKKKEGNRLL